MPITQQFFMKLMKAVTERILRKKLFIFKTTSQYSQENTCVGVTF